MCEVVDGHFCVAVVAIGDGDPVRLVVLEPIPLVLLSAALDESTKYTVIRAQVMLPKMHWSI